MASPLKVLLFGPARDALDGAHYVVVGIDSFPVTVDNLRTLMDTQFSALRFVLRNAVFAVNNSLISRNSESSTVISGPDSEIVLVPPVSGG